VENEAEKESQARDLKKKLFWMELIEINDMENELI